MKLYDHDPRYTQYVDKYEVKQLISNIKGLNVIPTIGLWDDAESIDISKLPEKFVLKCTHDSGSVLLFKSKDEYNEKEVKHHFSRALKRKQYLGGREWAYKNVKPRIIAEPYLEDDFGQGLRDYKFFCFDGQMKMLFIATDRGRRDVDVKFDFFDENFNHLPMKHGHENARIVPEKPKMFDEMKQISEQLSKGFRQVRVDLYEIDNKVYFGEMTFYHHSGFVPFEPQEWDLKMGEWINIE